MVCSDNPMAPLTLSRTVSASSMLVTAGGMGLISIILALILAGRHALHIAPAAIPAGLAAWALRSTGFGEILLRENSTELKQRFFFQFALEGLVWTVLIAAGYAVSHFLSRWIYKASINDFPWDKPSDTDKKNALWRRYPWLRCLLAFLVSGVLAGILLFLMTRAGSVRLDGLNLNGLPMKGQIVFSVFISFFLGTLIAHQLFQGRVYAFLAVPCVVSTCFYLAAYRSDTVKNVLAKHAVLFPAELLNAVVLPLPFIAIGSLGLLWGYWYSVQLIEARKHLRLI